MTRSLQSPQAPTAGSQIPGLKRQRPTNHVTIVPSSFLLRYTLNDELTIPLCTSKSHMYLLSSLVFRIGLYIYFLISKNINEWKNYFLNYSLYIEANMSKYERTSTWRLGISKVKDCLRFLFRIRVQMIVVDRYACVVNREVNSLFL